MEEKKGTRIVNSKIGGGPAPVTSWIVMMICLGVIHSPV